MLLRFSLFLFLASFTANAAEFLWLSDIHFNPLADAALVNKLAAAEPAQWAAILDTGSAKFPDYRQDTTWPLFSSVLKAAAKVEAKPALVMVTGDLLVHHFPEQFEASATVHSDEAYRSFVLKTAQFVIMQLQRLAPGGRVIAALGNNDDVCGDYAIQPGGDFLRGSAPFLPTAAGVSGDSYLRFGAYNAANPAAKHQRIIVLNSVFFSPKYNNRCGQSGDDPGASELAWLDEQLKSAEQHHDKVWLVYHQPPGLDAYATVHAKPAGSAVFLWKETYMKQFKELLSRHAKTVGPNFSGHIHVDDFRILGDTLVIGNSALSPITGQNPTFRYVRVDPAGNLQDERTFFLANLSQTLNGVAPDWQLEYDFAKDWQAKQLNAQTYQKLLNQVRTSPTAAERWMNAYTTRHPEGSGITPRNFPQFYCVDANISADGYKACVSAIPAALH